MAEPFTCKAQPTADPPQDCNWPICGCDPYADKVLSAFVEAGYKMVADDGETERLRKALHDIIGLDHHNHGPESAATKLARSALNIPGPLMGRDQSLACTCHPDDNPPVPCPQKYALTECRAAAALTAAEREP